LLVLFPARVKPLAVEKRYTPPPVFRRHAAVRLIFPTIWIGLLVAGIPFMLQAGFNPNLLDLQAPNIPSAQLIRKVQTWSCIVLSKDLTLLAKARSAVANLPQVARTESVLDAHDNFRW